MKKLIATLAIATSALALAAPAQADPAETFHFPFSWGPAPDDECAFPLTVAVEGAINFMQRNTPDITLPGQWIYGHVVGREEQTFTGTGNTVTATHQWRYLDVPNTYSEVGGVVTSLGKVLDVYTLTTSDGTLLAQGTGTATLQAIYDFNLPIGSPGFYTEVLLTETGDLAAYFDGFCSTIAPYVS